MGEFNGFSEAARLYAENVAIVEQMHKAYTDCAAAFRRDVEQEIQRLVAPRKFNTYVTKGQVVYWWLGERAYQDSAYLWFKNEPSDFDHAGIVPGGGVERATEEQIRALSALASKPNLRLERPPSRSKYELFEIQISFESSDPAALVTLTAERVAPVLLAMTTAFDGAAPKPVRRR